MSPEVHAPPLAAPSPQAKVAAPLTDLHFAKRVIIALGVAAIAYFLWLTSDVMMLVFAAILVRSCFDLLLRSSAGGRAFVNRYRF